VSSTKVFLAACMAFVAIPAGATAATPPPRALFGGGAIGAKYLPTSTHDVTWVNARVSKDQKTVDFYADVDLFCGGQNAGVYLTFATVPLKSGGRFSGSDPIEPETNSGLTGVMKFSGRFTGKGVASGSLTITGTKSGTPCEKRNIDWEMRAPFLAPHHRAAKTGGTYYGTTKDTFPAMVRTNASGTRLRQASIEYLFKCQNNTQEQYGNEVTPGAPISKTGRFHSKDHFSHPFGQPGSGMPGHWASTVEGKVQGDRATGTWKIDITITRDSDGAVVDTCTAGSIAFTAAK
jgi:hypothetical protein